MTTIVTAALIAGQVTFDFVAVSAIRRVAHGYYAHLTYLHPQQGDLKDG